MIGRSGRTPPWGPSPKIQQIPGALDSFPRVLLPHPAQNLILDKGVAVTFMLDSENGMF